MKILVICQYYYPEPFRISDICEELVKRGNDVTVVTGVPNYPMGELYTGYENGTHGDETINGVKVHRCPIHPRKKGAFHRLWNYYSFSVRSQRYVKKLDSSYDIVFVYQLSPVMMANAGIKYAKRYGKKVVLYSLDLWPASLSAGGLNHGIVYNWFYRESKKIYKAVDKILVSSKSFANYFKDEFGIEETEYLPQYAEEAFSLEECRKEPDEYIDLMFAGNIGSAQNVDTIIRAAALCKDMPNVRWHIVGDGVELDNCRRLAEELTAPVVFHGRKPIEEMPKYYAIADAMLVTMKKDPIISLTLPGKVQSYMAAGKPILASANGETAEIIQKAACGICAPTEDPNALAESVKTFLTQDSAAYAKNAVTFYTENFRKETFFTRLLDGFNT